MSTQPTHSGRKRWLWILGGALIVMVANVAVHVLYMVVYSYLINPGHDQPFYNEHAMKSGPYSSIVAGIPLMFIVCRWICRKFDAGSSVSTAVLIWLVYFLIDFTIVAAFGGLFLIAILFIASFATKFASAYLAGLFVRREKSKA
jgi:cell division protein FtsW (lipid II flippase)